MSESSYSPTLHVPWTKKSPYKQLPPLLPTHSLCPPSLKETRHQSPPPFLFQRHNEPPPPPKTPLHIPLRTPPFRHPPSQNDAFPSPRKNRRLFLSLYFRSCGLSPYTVDLNPTTTVHFWASTHRRHHKPSLVLLHGFGGDSLWQFAWQIRSLSASFNLFVPDLLFFGRSFTNSADRTVENQARCVMEGLKSGFGVGRCSVYAISYGGWVGYWMAEIYPEVVEKVVIVSSGVGFSEEQRTVHLKKLGRSIEDLLIPGGPTDLRALVDLVTYKHRFNWVPNFFLGQFVQVTHENYKQERRELVDHLLKQTPDSQYLPSITQETLLIWGDQDRIFPPYMAYQLQRHLGPKASVSIIKDCGHAVNMDAPHEANELVKSFLLR